MLIPNLTFSLNDVILTLHPVFLVLK